MVKKSGPAADRVTLRVTRDVTRRADALVKKLAKDSAVFPVSQVTRSTVLKLAMIRGLEQLEREHK